MRLGQTQQTQQTQQTRKMIPDKRADKPQVKIVYLKGQPQEPNRLKGGLVTAEGCGQG